MGHRPKLGSYGKNWIFGPKTEILGPKKNSLSQVHHVLVTTGKSCSKKKSALAQIIKGGNVILGDFFGVRPIFRPKTSQCVKLAFLND